MNCERISSGMISGSSAFGTSGIQLLKYLIGAVVADALDVREDERQQRERERDRERRGGGVDRPTPGTRVYVSAESGSGMKPSMFTTQMKIISVATYGNQRPIAFVGRPCSATWVWAIS